MNKEKININKINFNEIFLLSFPIETSKCKRLYEKFPFIDFILLDKNYNLIYGYECLQFLKENNVDNVPISYADISEKEALIIAYNFKEKFFGFNTYEKLVFIQKALNFYTINELYNAVDIDISINQDIIKKLQRLLSDEFKENLINDKINIKSALQLCNWEIDDSKIINELFKKISFSKSHQLNLIEMLEELIFKEKNNAKTIFEKLNLTALYLNEKPQKQIIDRVFKRRYPKYQRESEKWETEIKKIKIPQNISVSHYPFFERQYIELKININNIEKLREIIEKFTD